MQIIIKKYNSETIAAVYADSLLITDAQSALDLLASVNYETGCNKIILKKEAITEEFFHLSTRLAGEVLQKFINYHMKLAIVGDFSYYKSQSLRDFIYESNKGKDIFFVQTEEEALSKLANAL